MKWPTIFVALSVALVTLAACYRCLDPACSNVPPVSPDYPAASRDASTDH